MHQYVDDTIMSTCILCRSVAFSPLDATKSSGLKLKQCASQFHGTLFTENHETLSNCIPCFKRTPSFYCDTSWEGVSVSCDYTVQQNYKLFFQKIQITLFSRGILTFFLPSNEQFLNFGAVKLFLFFLFYM